MMPKIDNKFEKFDLSIFKNSKLEDDVLRENLKDGSYVEYHRSRESRGIVNTPKNSYFTITKNFYKSGNIKLKGLYLNVAWGGFKKGIWYEFNEKGELIKEIDYDKPYHFSFEDILAFCAKEKIPVDKGPILQSTGYHTMITRNEDVKTSGAVWEIKWLKKPDIEESIKLDGKTGKILERKEVSFTNN